MQPLENNDAVHESQSGAINNEQVYYNVVMVAQDPVNIEPNAKDETAKAEGENEPTRDVDDAKAKQE